MKKFISALLVFASIASMVSCAMISADAATIKGDINGDNQITFVGVDFAISLVDSFR